MANTPKSDEGIRMISYINIQQYEDIEKCAKILREVKGQKVNKSYVNDMVIAEGLPIVLAKVKKLEQEIIDMKIKLAEKIK